MIEAAQQHYLTGTRFFEAGSWDASLVEFTASFQLSGERDLLHNISWTHEKAGRTREALDYAERYWVACRGTEDEERAVNRVAFLKSKYGSLASGAASTGQAAPAPVASPMTPSAVSGVTAAPSAVSTSSRAEGRAKVADQFQLSSKGLGFSLTGSIVKVQHPDPTRPALRPGIVVRFKQATANQVARVRVLLMKEKQKYEQQLLLRTTVAPGNPTTVAPGSPTTVAPGSPNATQASLMEEVWKHVARADTSRPRPIPPITAPPKS